MGGNNNLINNIMPIILELTLLIIFGAIIYKNEDNIINYINKLN